MPKSDWNRPESFNAPENRRRVALEISYDGRFFCGWQSQKEDLSVQESIRKAAEKYLKDSSAAVVGSGRTDSGVHAKAQVAHLEMKENSIPASAFAPALNALLPKQIRITSSWDVPSSFHARYSTMAREYRYFIKEGRANPFEEGLVTFIKKFPSLDLLSSYASRVCGVHDFTAFSGAQDSSVSKVRDIYECSFFFEKDRFEEKVLVFRICGNAFLYHMVRSLVGSMLEFANEGMSAEQFKAVLDSRQREKAGKTAPSDGLYLWRVSYDENEYSWFEEKFADERK